VVELPYVAGSPDRELTLLLLLPDQVHGLADVEAKLTPQMLANPEQAFRMTSVKTQVKIPRFKVSGSFSLSDTLAGLGMPHLFDGSKADLSGMDGTRELFISKVLHKAFIEVNEEGSEAAAATAVVAQLRSMPRIMEFTAFQPFLAMVRHKATGTILFLGRVTRPEAAAAPAGEKQEL
jgi:serpin B